MNSLIMGLPGAGKGTQAKLIINEYDINHISTGNLFRDLLKTDSELSNEVKSYINQGNLVPDDVTIKILKEEIKKDKYKDGFLLDGFPRTIEQAKALNFLLKEMEMKLDNIIFIDVNEEIIVDRLSKRLTCPECQATYHEVNNAPKEKGICDNCGANLIKRDDDQPEKIKNRIKIAKEETLPVIEFYKDDYNVIEINAEDKKIDVVFNEIKGKIQ